MKERIKLFLRGMLMGLCDLIPGISGGTIAFITGIYEKLINSLKGFSPELFKSIAVFAVGKGNKHDVKENIKKIDLPFLITLVAGIGTAILLFSHGIAYLLEEHFSLTMAFFIGLILTSAKVIFDHIEKHHSWNVFFAALGFIGGLSLLWAIPAEVNPSLWYVLLGGFVAICAMILPGISGSFILLLMGLYQYMLEAIQNPLMNLKTIIVFLIGAVLGLGTISRLISFLMKKDKSKTLYFLLGLVVGALSTPVRDSIAVIDFSPGVIIAHIIVLLLGAVSEPVIKYLSKRKGAAVSL